MSRNDALVTVLGLLLLFLFLVSPVACTMHRHYRIQQAIAGGADPVAAKCAIEEETDRSPLCIANQLRGGQK